MKEHELIGWFSSPILQHRVIISEHQIKECLFEILVPSKYSRVNYVLDKRSSFFSYMITQYGVYEKDWKIHFFNQPTIYKIACFSFKYEEAALIFKLSL